jgi:choline transport protein
LITAGVGNLALAASLAEFISAFPTSAGQYHWAAIVTPKRWVPIVSWVTGWVNVAGWVALSCTGGLLGSQLIIGAISFFDDSYTSHPWQQFLIYLAYTFVAFLVNAFGTRLLPMITQTAFIWSIAGFVVICITLLACSSPNYQSGSFVYSDFINETGWPDGFAWLLGLLQGVFGLTGFDAVAHMIEEIRKSRLNLNLETSPRREAPAFARSYIGVIG